jgi:crotonobetainyl-CoA:carnitine CoA-transferase CaiB-like acyl-CoA transferase
LAALIEDITAQASCAEWLRRLEVTGIPCGPIHDYAQVFADPQVVAREMAVDVEHPVLGRLRTLGTPIKMSATPLNVRRRAPLLGEHTVEVLRAAGLGDDEIAKLRDVGAIS